MRTHEDVVLEQFDPKARAYLASAVHAAGPDLVHAHRLALRVATPDAAMLDVGCGAGHLSFALAPAFRRVVASDPSPSMLAAVAAEAERRSLPQIEARPASACDLPFGAGTFMIVGSRYSAHHWRDVPSSLREMRRVVRADGYLLMIDLLGDDTPLVDTHLQAIELLRDPSHGRDHTVAEWRALLGQAGFELLEEAAWPTRLEFGSWVERMRTPPELVAAIRRVQAGAPKEVWDALSMEADGSFTARTGLFWARAA